MRLIVPVIHTEETAGDYSEAEKHHNGFNKP